MTQYRSYDMVGIKEDISDVITNLTPTETPFQASLKTETTKNRTVQWQEDSLRAVNTSNQQLEGFASTTTARVPTVMRSNVTQIMAEFVEVSGTAEAVESYGRSSEQAYQLAKASNEVKRDFEHMLIGRVQATVVGDNATARRMASAWSQIGANTTQDPGSSVALSETNILALAQKIYTEGGDGDILMIKPSDATIVAGFAGLSARTRDVGTDKKIVNSVDIYVSPFGDHKVVKNRFQITSRALMYSPKNWRKVALRPWFKEMLAKTGDQERHQIVGEYTLKHFNFLCSGAILNVA